MKTHNKKLPIGGTPVIDQEVIYALVDWVIYQQ